MRCKAACVGQTVTVICEHKRIPGGSILLNSGLYTFLKYHIHVYWLYLHSICSIKQDSPEFALLQA